MTAALGCHGERVAPSGANSHINCVGEMKKIGGEEVRSEKKKFNQRSRCEMSRCYSFLFYALHFTCFVCCSPFLKRKRRYSVRRFAARPRYLSNYSSSFLLLLFAQQVFYRPQQIHRGAKHTKGRRKAGHPFLGEKKTATAAVKKRNAAENYDGPYYGNG